MASQKIMIIDDNGEFTKELEETLDMCGYETYTFFDGMSAISLARKIKPDVILLDMRMTKTNGFQVAEQLKQSAATAGIPIIAMSGYFDVENDSSLLDMSKMDGRIAKPFTIFDLTDMIESVTKKIQLKH